MIYAYVIHGPSAAVIDGLRLLVFVLACWLAGLMLRYARNLWRYTKPVRWRGSVREYVPRWVERNKRLLGRILLCVTWLFFLITVVGTEIKHWGDDMGYWRLPCNIVALVASIFALRLLIRWNTLSAD